MLASRPRNEVTTIIELLGDLTHHFIRSIADSDVAWFDAHLAPDFMNTNADGSFIDRAAFLAQIGRGPTVKSLQEHDVLVRVLGDFAIIHARTTYLKPDGQPGQGRFTDDWQLRDGRWLCVSAHVTRL
jgi:ketosteroid isomerase-like protein